MGDKPIGGLRVALAAGACAVAVILGGCEATQVSASSQVGEPPLCAPGVELGEVTVALSFRWRPDQKEPREREQLARQAIAKVFGPLRCGRFAGYVPPDAGFPAGAAGTRVELVVRELGPELLISLPALWSVNADVDYAVTATDLSSGKVRLRRAERRRFGGAFRVQGMDMVAQTFEQALEDLVHGGAP